MEPRRSSSAASSQPASAAAALGGGKSKGNVLNTVLVVLLIITSVLASAWLTLRLITTTNNNTAIKSKQYQALFLTNGQVYFGHLKSVDNSYVKLSDIFYLQVQQAVQPDAKTANSNQQVSLAKLGGELHGPEDTMYVSRDQVLFWENLKADGKVTQAIKDYQASGKK